MDHWQEVEKDMMLRAEIAGDPRIYTDWKKEREKEKREWEKQQERMLIEKRATLPFKGPALFIVSRFCKHNAQIYIDKEQLVFTDLDNSLYSFTLSAEVFKNAKISHSIFAGVFSSAKIVISLPNGAKYHIGVPKIPNHDSYLAFQIYLKAIENAQK